MRVFISPVEVAEEVISLSVVCSGGSGRPRAGWTAARDHRGAGDAEGSSAGGSGDRAAQPKRHAPSRHACENEARPEGARGRAGRPPSILCGLSATPFSINCERAINGGSYQRSFRPIVWCGSISAASGSEASVSAPPKDMGRRRLQPGNCQAFGRQERLPPSVQALDCRANAGLVGQMPTLEQRPRVQPQELRSRDWPRHDRRYGAENHQKMTFYSHSDTSCAMQQVSPRGTGDGILCVECRA